MPVRPHHCINISPALVTNDLLGGDSFRSQWFITFKPTPHLDKKHTVFGNLVGGDDVLDTLEKLSVKPGTERPAKPVRMTDIMMFVNVVTVFPINAYCDF